MPRVTWPRHCHDWRKHRCTKQKPARRLIHLWKRVDTEKKAEDLEHDLTCFPDSPAYDIPINNLWTTFKIICCNTITKHIPTKWTPSKLNQPWCNRKIKQLSRQKRRAFTRFKRTGRDKDRLRRKGRVLTTQVICVRHGKKCDSADSVPLRSDGNLHGDPPTKASFLNQQFSSVFTTEGMSNIPG